MAGTRQYGIPPGAEHPGFYKSNGELVSICVYVIYLHVCSMDYFNLDWKPDNIICFAYVCCAGRLLSLPPRSCSPRSPSARGYSQLSPTTVAVAMSREAGGVIWDSSSNNGGPGTTWCVIVHSAHRVSIKSMLHRITGTRINSDPDGSSIRKTSTRRHVSQSRFSASTGTSTPWNAHA
jgi:hypothetical protein